MCMNSSRITAESQPVTRNSPSPSSASFSSRRLRQRSDGILLELTQDRDHRDGYDNAAMESFWSSLKTETGLDRLVLETRKKQSLLSSITSRRFTTRRGATARSIRSLLWPSKTNNNKTTI